MSRTDWIPAREQDVVDLQAKWTETLSSAAKQTAYGWTAADCTAVTSALAAFTAARTAYLDVNSTDNRLAKDEAKEAAIDAMRDFANSHIRFNKLMSDPEKDFLGIKPKDTTITSHPVPSSQPDTDVRNTENHFEHRIRALNHEGEPSKPADAYGVRYAWQVGGVRPASGADLPKTQFSRRASIVIIHTEAQKGQTAYYAACYENSKGQAGPWSPVEEAIIG